MRAPAPLRGVALVAGLPALVLAAATVVLSGLGLAGANPLWPRTEVTFSEAAAARDKASVMQWLDEGRDPYRRYRIRAGLLGEEALDLTPMEAAIRENRDEIVALLLERGSATANAAGLCGWLRQAIERRSEAIPPILRAADPDGAAACASAPETR